MNLKFRDSFRLFNLLRSLHKKKRGLYVYCCQLQTCNEFPVCTGGFAVDLLYLLVRRIKSCCCL